MASTIKCDEQILVVPREHLFDGSVVQGFLPVHDFGVYQERISRYCQFQPRSLMETDPTYKQIIPYLIFSYQDQFFLMQRKSTASEQRLKDKHLLGVGGHLRKEDMAGTTIAEWALREMHEEIAYDGTYTMQPLGIINDERDLVGQVHIGFVFLVRADQPTFSVKSELKQGSLVAKQEVAEYYDRLESWSQMVFDYLNTTQSLFSHTHGTRELI